MPEARSHTLGQLQELLGGCLVGDATTRIDRVGTLATAAPGAIAFLANPKYRSQLKSTPATAVIVPESVVDSDLPSPDFPRIVAANPYAYYARVAQVLYPLPCPAQPVHPQAVLGEGVELGEGVVIQAGCVIGDRVKIGAGSLLHPNVTIYADCVIGQRAVIHAGAVIGADGFGFAKEGPVGIKIPQVGRVVIGDDVEIGANSTIDRGAIDDTVIGNGVKIDNQVQVGHNVTIGEHTALCGCVGIAGSARIGSRCWFGGGAIVLGHLSITDDVLVGAGSMVTKSLNKAGHYTGAFPLDQHEGWLKNAAQLRRLTTLAERVEQLERRLARYESVAVDAGITTENAEKKA